MSAYDDLSSPHYQRIKKLSSKLCHPSLYVDGLFEDVYHYTPFIYNELDFEDTFEYLSLLLCLRISLGYY